MKKLLAVLLAVIMTISFAAVGYAYAEPDSAKPGETVFLYDFYDSDGNECPDSGTKYLSSDYYGVSASWSGNCGNYIERVGINETLNEVYILFKDDVDLETDKNIVGKITLRLKATGDRYVMELEKGDLVLSGETKVKRGTTRILEDRYGNFVLPLDYDEYKVRFETEDGEDDGKLTARFGDDAYFNAKIVDQEPLFLGYSKNPVAKAKANYPKATMRFLNWTTNPQFNISGTMGIYMDPAEWIYGIDDNGKAYRLGGTYNTETKAYEFKTDTLKCYVISDIRLIEPAASSTASSASSVPASSSSAASSSSSTAPETSTGASESIPDQSSESSLPESSVSENPSSPAQGDVSDPGEEKGIGVMPFVVGALVVVVIIAVAVLSRKKKSSKFDDWEK